MNSILITGSNRGIGLELARQYAQQGWRVHACCRHPEQATELQTFADNTDNIQIHELDITSPEQINLLVDSLNGEAIDILFNNAGIYGQNNASFGNTDIDKWLHTFHVNTIAPLKLTEALVNNVASSELKTIATMSSKMGSMADNGSGGSYVYRSSKAALNAAFVSAAIDLKSRGIKIAILHPGWVKTDMGGPNAEIDTHTCVQQLMKTLDSLSLETSGSFFEIDGSIIPW